MKCLVRILVVLGMVLSLGGEVVYAAEQNHFDNNTPRPVYVNTATTETEAAAGTSVDTIAANSSRIGGYIENTSTVYMLKCSLTDSTTTEIAADFFIIPQDAVDSTYGENRWYFADKHTGAVYQGAVYIMSVSSATTMDPLGTPSVSVVEFNK